VASWAPGRLDVVALGPGSMVWHQPFESGVGWYGWNPLGGATDAAPGIAAPAPGVLEVMANATDTVWHRSWVGFWTEWAPLGGPSQSGPGASARSGRTEVFVQGPDRGVWHGVI